MTHTTRPATVAELENRAAELSRTAIFEFSPVQARFLRERAAALMDQAARQRQAELAAAAAQVRQPCPVCRAGCDCAAASGQLDCGHYGCWGRSRRPEPELPRCPGIAYELARTAAISAHQGTLHFARHRGPDVYSRVLTSILRAASLAPTAD